MTRYVGRGLLFAILGVTLGNVELVGPDGKRVTDPACIEGRLSTVDPRWAMAFLSNTNGCVRRYGAPVPSWHRHPG